MIFLCFGVSLMAQYNISGYVLNTDNAPIPFATVFVKELQTGTAADANGRYFLTMQPGSYEIVFSSVGYENYSLFVVLGERDQTHNVQLQTSVAQLDELVVSAKRKDPAYDIVRKVIENREQFKTQINSQTTTLYIKATETVTTEIKDKDKKIEVVLLEEEGDFNEPQIQVEEGKKPKAQLNMVEMEVLLDYEAPNNYLEERTAYGRYGNTSGLFVPRYDNLDFNFYDNLVYLKALTEVPVVSPIATTSILTYKYKLVSTYKEPQGVVYKIKVTPRKKGNSSCSGYIYVNDGIWNLNKVEITFSKGTLKFYDDFELIQDYELINDSLWLVNRQEFNYETKERKTTTFKGSTVITYKDRIINPIFEKGHFGPMVSLTTKDAYERDSSYWSQIRPEPLKTKEAKLVKSVDSIKAIRNSQEYKDSMEALYNKVTLTEVIYDGLGFRKDDKRHLYITPLLSLLNYHVVGGWRINPYASYFHRFNNGTYLATQNSFSWGIKNGDINGFQGVLYRYNPFKFGDIRINYSRYYSSINNYDAFLNQLSVSNYIRTEHVNFYHRIELFNGFFFSTNLSYDRRSSIDNLNFNTTVNQWVGDRDPLEFEDYDALVSDIRISYSPGQQYMLEADRKIILRNPYPTFSLNHKKGWNAFGSNVDFDYLGFSIYQSFNVGIFGKSTYRASVGGFLNTKNLPFVDYKRFRQSDPWLFNNPLYSFQLLDTSLVISTMYYEAHYMHQFNGALINNIPLLKKSRIMAVAGAGALWINDPNYRYVEVLAGVERIFKLGARRRLKLGVYGVIGESNISRTSPGLKFSIDVIDTWKTDWSYQF